MKNEKTSAKVAKIAAQVLDRLVSRMKIDLEDGDDICPVSGMRKVHGFMAVYEPICTAAELKSLAASALTQTADKKKP